MDLIKETNEKAQMHISHVKGDIRNIPENKNCDFVIINWKLCGRVEQLLQNYHGPKTLKSVPYSP